MTIDINSVSYRLDLILDYLNEIKPLASISLDEFLHNRYLLRAAERLLEITIQAVIDINNTQERWDEEKGWIWSAQYKAPKARNKKLIALRDKQLLDLEQVGELLGGVS